MPLSPFSSLVMFLIGFLGLALTAVGVSLAKQSKILLIARLVFFLALFLAGWANLAQNARKIAEGVTIEHIGQ